MYRSYTEEIHSFILNSKTGFERFSKITFWSLPHGMAVNTFMHFKKTIQTLMDKFLKNLVDIR